jgi:hypothetical protein
MKRIVIIAVLALPGLLVAETIHTNLRLFQLTKDQSALIMQGSWRRTSTRPTIEIPAANSFRIECIRDSGMCREYVAKLITPAEAAASGMNGTYLYVDVQTFKIQNWDAKGIVAKAEPRAADIYLRVSLEDHTAERTSQETNARGATGATKDIDVWQFK